MFDPFQIEGKEPVPQQYRPMLVRMAELVKEFCQENNENDLNYNYSFISDKDFYKQVFKGIGFKEKHDFWISRNWSIIPLKILGWDDVQNRIENMEDQNIMRDRMIEYGKRRWGNII